VLVTCSSVLLFSGFLLYFVLPYWLKKLWAKSQARRLRGTRQVCLTFDDGPDPEVTPKILDLLETARAHATFFLLGRRAESHPEIVRMILARGHEIGEHGYDHLNAWRTSPWRYGIDLARGHRAFGRMLEAGHARLFRPPYGKMNLVTLLYIVMAGVRPVFWSIDSKDFEAGDAASVAERVRREMLEGGIVLMHDGRVRPWESSRQVTTEALIMLLGQAKAEPCTYPTISTALGLGDCLHRHPDSHNDSI
jgi:peptidoglycan-N-acetylglucosamine deacetylase